MFIFAILENIIIFLTLSYVVFILDYSGWWFLIAILFNNSKITTQKKITNEKTNDNINITKTQG